jgi:hypothetical protein
MFQYAIDDEMWPGIFDAAVERMTLDPPGVGVDGILPCQKCDSFVEQALKCTIRFGSPALLRP